jgi:hypothetical protein
MGTENEYIRDRNMELQSKVLWLQGELDGLLRTLEEIRTLNSLGKTREITDEIINPILKAYNR